jgi:hypothetical protein
MMTQKYDVRFLVLSLVLATTALVLPACRSHSAEPSPSSGEQAKAEEHDGDRPHYYSPFMLKADDAKVFKTITFTDVGLKQPEPGPVDPVLLETIAESLAQKIAEHESLDFTPAVSYDRGLLDPANHLFCEQHHLYIALWRGYDPDRWGYSLWSGCEEEHQFAWKEIPDPSPTGSDLVTAVEPLTQSIAETLAEATSRSCFVARC